MNARSTRRARAPRGGHSWIPSWRRPATNASRTGRWRRLAALAALAATGACQPPSMGRAVHPAEIPALQARLQRETGATGLMVRLGAAYRESGHLEDARATLERAAGSDPGNASAAIFLALTLEDQGAWEEAALAYGRFVDLAPPGELRTAAARRVPLLRRRALEADVRAARERERELANTEPSPGTVAVFPFRYVGADESLAPLGRVLADFLVTDLSQTDRLRVLERTRVQLLLDEIGLRDQGLVEPASAARSGLILGAGRIVQGQIGGDESRLGFDVAVVPVGRGDLPLPPPIRESDAAARLFEVEQRIALGVFEALGIQLTAAERERINRRPTENVQALLAYGLGLEAEDRGDFAEAARHFARAVELDPGFQEAAEAGGRAGELAAVGATTAALERAALQQMLPPGGLEDWLTLRHAFHELDPLLPAPELRDPAQEILGSEGLTFGRTFVEILLRLP